MSKIKAILFDFFGVIRSDEYESWLKRHGYERTGAFAEISKSSDSGATTLQQSFDELSSLSHIPALDIQLEFETYDTVDEDVVKIIRTLKKHYKIGLLSNSNGDHLRDTLKECGLGSLFDEIVISGEVGYIKPSKEIFLYALNQMQAKPEETIFIDDNKVNVDSAIKLGIKGLWFKDSQTLENDLRNLGFKVN